LLVPVNADLAHAAGFTGEGIKVGILDDVLVADYAPLEGRIAWQRNYNGEGSVDTKPGHGTVVTTVLGGAATTGFGGGIAPDASIYMGFVCDDDGCSTTAARQAIRDMGAEGVRIFN